MIMVFTDTDLLSAEQQVCRLEAFPPEKNGRAVLEKIRRTLKRDYERRAISTMAFVEYSQRVNVLSGEIQ